MKPPQPAGRAPTPAEVSSAIQPREVGARQAQGPLADLGRGRWGVPAVAYMSRIPLGDLVLHFEAGAWKAERPVGAAAARSEDDDLDPFVRRATQTLQSRSKGRAA